MFLTKNIELSQQRTLIAKERESGGGILVWGATYELGPMAWDLRGGTYGSGPMSWDLWRGTYIYIWGGTHGVGHMACGSVEYAMWYMAYAMCPIYVAYVGSTFAKKESGGGFWCLSSDPL